MISNKTQLEEAKKKAESLQDKLAKLIEGKDILKKKDAILKAKAAFSKARQKRVEEIQAIQLEKAPLDAEIRAYKEPEEDSPEVKKQKEVDAERADMVALVQSMADEKPNATVNELVKDFIESECPDDIICEVLKLSAGGLQDILLELSEEAKTSTDGTSENSNKDGNHASD